MPSHKFYRAVIRRITKKEKGKSQVSIGNVREIVGIIADMQHASEKVRGNFRQMGRDRAKRKKRK